jgi:murein L,D-transpeptidase YafK
MRYKTFFTRVTHKISYTDWATMKKKQTLFAIIIIFLAFSLNIYGAGDKTETDILKKISSFSIREAMKSSNNIGELAGKIGVNEEELRRVCLTLSINLDAYGIKEKVVEPVKVPPVVKTAPLEKKTAELLVSADYEPDVIVEYNGISPYVIFVEKSSHTVFIVKYENGKKTLMGTFDCKTGKKPGDKKVQGDHKTPVGIFYLIDKMNRQQIEQKVGKQNAYMYGETAFITDYPNALDQLNDKDGGGIWLHGTDEPFSETSALDTRGCVVTTNESIKIISNYIDLKKTPLVIVETLNFIDKKSYLATRQEVIDFMESWRSAWEQKKIDDYIKCYAPIFEDRGKKLPAFKEYKSGIFKAYNINYVKIENLVVIRHSSGMIAQFNQDYSADNLSSVNMKTLYLINEKGSWEIAAERIRN